MAGDGFQGRERQTIADSCDQIRRAIALQLKNPGRPSEAGKRCRNSRCHMEMPTLPFGSGFHLLHLPIEIEQGQGGSPSGMNAHGGVLSLVALPSEAVPRPYHRGEWHSENNRSNSAPRQSLSLR